MNRFEYMRKWICLAGLCLLFSSCFPSDPETTTPQYYSFVTTSITQEEGSSKSVVTFLTDTDKMLSVSNDEGLYKKVRDGQRAVVYFDLVEGSAEDNLPSLIKIHQIDTNVVVGKVATVKTDDERRKIGDEAIDVNLSPNFPNLTPKFFNLYICAVGAKPEKHTFTMVYVQDDPGTDKEVNFTLCHNSNLDSVGYAYWHWISLPRADFEYLLVDKEAANLKVKTTTSGMQSLKFQLKAKN